MNEEYINKYFLAQFCTKNSDPHPQRNQYVSKY